MPRRTRERGGSTQVPLNLTPLLDVVLQLITFFMMLIHFGTKIEGASQAIRLPTAPAALPSSELKLDRLIVLLDANGRILTDGKALEGKAASDWWAEQAKARRQGQETLGGSVRELATLVILRADRDARYAAVRQALQEAQARGFAHFTLVVLRGAS